MKPARPGLGSPGLGFQGLASRLDARFRPGVYWGAEFLEGNVRLCGLVLKEGRPFSEYTFEGNYVDAETFAANHNIGRLGLHAAVSHIPFKLQSMGPVSTSGEEDVGPYAENQRPQGLGTDAFDLFTFPQGGERHLVMAREDVLNGFSQSLPLSLSSLESLCVSPVALLEWLDVTSMRGWQAAILAEADISHILFFQNGTLKNYVKVFCGWEQAKTYPDIFQKEMKKALIYYFGSRFPDTVLASVQIWHDGDGNEVATSIKALGILQATQAWLPPVSAIPDGFRVAAAMALCALKDTPGPESFSIPQPKQVVQHRFWMRRAGVLAKVGTQVLAGVSIGLLLLVLSALAMRYTVASKAKTWSNELSKWDEYQKRKALVESQIESIQELLKRRTQVYATMQNVAKCMPTEVWLESWEMETQSENAIVHRLSGLSIAEGRIPEFLNNLEHAKSLGVVKLKSTERIKGETVEQKTNIRANRKDLVRFQIGISE